MVADGSFLGILASGPNMLLGVRSIFIIVTAVLLLHIWCVSLMPISSMRSIVPSISSSSDRHYDKLCEDS